MINEYDKSLLLKIAHRLKEGTASSQEQDYFDRWYLSLKDDQLELSEDDTDQVTSIRDRMHTKILNEIEQPQKNKAFKISLRTIIGIAASLVLVGFALFYMMDGFIFSKDSTPVNTNAVSDIKPGLQTATLTLADGRQIDLSEVEEGQLTAENGVIISKSVHGELIYQRSSDGHTNKMNMISTAYGQTYRVKLADGTSVWLNAGSSLKFPLVFGKDERKVYLEGEGYFEVAKNDKAPFKVVSGRQTVEVLGTHFNISAYSNEEQFKTTLLEGKVKVSEAENSAILVVGQQARVNKNKAGVTISEVDLDEVIAWKDGYFRFREEEIGSIMLKLSRWYDVNVSFAGRVSTEKFTGTISRSKNIHQVLELLEATKVVHFKIEGRRIFVME